MRYYIDIYVGLSNYSIRKVAKKKQSFPTTDAAMKFVFMALQNISKK